MKKSAAIVETRLLPNLIQVINSHMIYLNGWHLIVIGSSENEEEIKLNFPTCSFVNIGNKMNIDTYNLLLTNKAFWECLKCDRVLIFQYDSALLKEGIEDFLEYDYVGAPWKFQLHGGNGGLSLRNPQSMIKVIESIKYDPSRHGNEDVYFTNHLELSGSKLAPREICSKFSCESIFKMNTLGYHAIEKYLTEDQVSQIKNQYNGKLQIQKRA